MLRVLTDNQYLNQSPGVSDLGQVYALCESRIRPAPLGVWIRAPAPSDLGAAAAGVCLNPNGTLLRGV